MAIRNLFCGSGIHRVGKLCFFNKFMAIHQYAQFSNATNTASAEQVADRHQLQLNILMTPCVSVESYTLPCSTARVLNCVWCHVTDSKYHVCNTQSSNRTRHTLWIADFNCTVSSSPKCKHTLHFLPIILRLSLLIAQCCRHCCSHHTVRISTGFRTHMGITHSVSPCWWGTTAPTQAL